MLCLRTLLLGCALSISTVPLTLAQDTQTDTQKDAQTDIQTGIGIVCDTKTQVERVLAIAEQNPRTALAQVNDEAGKVDACVVAPVIYVPGAKVAHVANRLGTFDVVEILVVGLATPNGAQLFTEPVIWFTVFKSEGSNI